MNYMLCYDGSPNSEIAFNYILKVIQHNDGIWLYHAFNNPSELIIDPLLQLTDSVGAGSKADYNQEVIARKESSAKVLDTLVEKLRQHPVSINSFFLLIDHQLISKNYKDNAEKNYIELAVSINELLCFSFILSLCVHSIYRM